MVRGVAFLAGLVFGLGLILSGMTSPMRVLGFLDVAGAWDPRLAFVMGGGLLVAIPFYAVTRHRGGTILGGQVETPTSSSIDPRLLGGAAIFGIGWGLGGLCPGPAWVDLMLVPGRVLVFVVPMALGLLLTRR